MNVLIVENIVYIGLDTTLGRFRASIGGLGLYPPWIRGTTVISVDSTIFLKDSINHINPRGLEKIQICSELTSMDLSNPP